MFGKARIAYPEYSEKITQTIHQKHYWTDPNTTILSKSKRKQNLPILVLSIVCLFLIGIVLFFVIRNKQSNSTVTYEPYNDTNVSSPETSKQCFLSPFSQTDNQGNDADDAHSTTLKILRPWTFDTLVLSRNKALIKNLLTW